MRFQKFLCAGMFACVFITSSLFSANFTAASYNCGGLSDHYDYIRAVCMHKLVQERYNAEPKEMAQLENIQSVALKILFSSNALEKEKAQQEWEKGGYTDVFAKLTAHPNDLGSINTIWREKSDGIVTAYNQRPVIIHDAEVNEILHAHVSDLTKGQDRQFGPENELNDWLDVTRRIMAERIFKHQLQYDMISLQEADYLDASLFPSHYEVRFSDDPHSINGLAWNKEKFEFIDMVGDIPGRGFVVALCDIKSGKTIAVASAHLSGCNPFCVEMDEESGDLDSAKGDKELLQILDILENSEADIKMLAMDSNVTAMHPRLSLLKEAGYVLDCSKYLEPTCTNPWQVLNTRIDWIAVKSSDDSLAISNVPVLGVTLNSPQTNISDHKPVAARIIFRE